MRTKLLSIATFSLVAILIVASQTIPDGAGGEIQFTGVPTGTISTNGTLVASNLSSGTYTSTQVDSAPDFELTAVEFDDGDSATPSSGDPATRTAVFNPDPGETVRCLLTNETFENTSVAGNSGGTMGSSPGDGGQNDPTGGRNPFENPAQDLEGVTCTVHRPFEMFYTG